MATVTETALAVTHETSHEIAVTPQQAMAAKEIEGAIILARRFPRNEDDIRARALESFKRPKMAAIARYRFPRGSKDVEGTSVYSAREMARLWTNLRYGFDIIFDDEDSRTIRGWAWDIETNTKRTQDATFKKLIQRKDKKSGITRWVQPDERDLRELTNRQGETAVRNCLIYLLPPDMVDDCMEQSITTLRNDAAKDPSEARKKLVLAFRGVGVTAEQLEQYIGHKLAVITPDEIADLRGIWKSITDGNSRWAEYMKPAEKEKTDANVSMDDLTGAKSDAKQEPKPDNSEAAITSVAHRNQYFEELREATTVAACESLRDHAADNPDLQDDDREEVVMACNKKAVELGRAARGKKANGELFEPERTDATAEGF